MLPGGAFFELIDAVISIRSKVANVSEVQNTFWCVAISDQSAKHEIPINIAREVADVRKIVNGWTTSINLNLVRIDWLEVFGGTLQRLFAG